MADRAVIGDQGDGPGGVGSRGKRGSLGGRGALGASERRREGQRRQGGADSDSTHGYIIEHRKSVRKGRSPCRENSSAGPRPDWGRAPGPGF